MNFINGYARPVVCMWCGNRYRSVWNPEELDENTQGDSCAAVCGYNRAKGFWYVEAFYGSGYDLSVYRFAKTADEPTDKTVKFDPVCDNCIAERISAGVLEFEKEARP